MRACVDQRMTGSNGVDEQCAAVRRAASIGSHARIAIREQWRIACRTSGRAHTGTEQVTGAHESRSMKQPLTPTGAPVAVPVRAWPSGSRDRPRSAFRKADRGDERFVACWQRRYCGIPDQIKGDATCPYPMWPVAVAALDDVTWKAMIYFRGTCMGVR